MRIHVPNTISLSHPFQEVIEEIIACPDHATLITLLGRFPSWNFEQQVGNIFIMSNIICFIG